MARSKRFYMKDFSDYNTYILPAMRDAGMGAYYEDYIEKAKEYLIKHKFSFEPENGYEREGNMIMSRFSSQSEYQNDVKKYYVENVENVETEDETVVFNMKNIWEDVFVRAIFSTAARLHNIDKLNIR